MRVTGEASAVTIASDVSESCALDQRTHLRASQMATSIKLGSYMRPCPSTVITVENERRALEMLLTIMVRVRANLFRKATQRLQITR